MEMERINENTIRVSIDNDDLIERGITFLDLLGNQKQIENFFYSILEEVDVDDQFQETDSVTFQVLPNREGLELFISKNIEPSDMNGFDSLSTDQTDGFTEFLKNHIVSQEEGDVSDLLDDEMDYVAGNNSKTSEFVFRVTDFEDIIRIARVIPLYNVLTSIYYYKEAYFLSVTFFEEESTDQQVKNDVSLVYEHAERTFMTTDTLDEYGELIVERNALSLIKYYFGK